MSELTLEQAREESHQHLVVGLRLIRPIERVRATHQQSKRDEHSAGPALLGAMFDVGYFPPNTRRVSEPAAAMPSITASKVDQRRGSKGLILLQKSFCTEGRKFCGPPMRFSCKDVGGLIAPC